MTWQDNYLEYVMQRRKLEGYYEIKNRASQIYNIGKMLRGVYEEKSTAKEVDIYTYSNSAHRNWQLKLKRVQIRNTVCYTTDLVELSENVSKNEGITTTADTGILWYTNSDGRNDLEYTIELDIVLNKVSLLVTLKKLIDFEITDTVKGTAGSYLIDGQAASSLGSLWGFDTIPVSSKQYTTEWLKKLLPQWISNLGGPL